MPETVERILKTGDIVRITILEKESNKIKSFKIAIHDKEKDKPKTEFEVPSKWYLPLKTYNKEMLIEFKPIKPSPHGWIEIELRKGRGKGKYKEFDFRVTLLRPEKYTPSHARLLFDFYTRLKHDKKIGEEIFKLIEGIYTGTPAEDIITKNQIAIERINKTPGMDIRAFLKLLELIFIQEDLNYPPDKKNSTGKYYEGRDKTFSLFRKVKNGKKPIEALMEADLSIKLDPNKFSININNLIEVLVNVYNNENNVIEALEELGIKIGS